MKNIRKHNRRIVLRARRRGQIPSVIMTTPTGTRVTVTPYRPGRASYWTRHATVFGPWPPTASTMTEIHRWS
jgi:hypothetical protein